jgi:hypothetical protein
MGEMEFAGNVNREYTGNDIKLTDITQYLKLFIAEHHNRWSGTVASLLKQINASKPLNDRQWPHTPLEMAKWLQIAIHEHFKNGIVVRYHKRHGVRMIDITV